MDGSRYCVKRALAPCHTGHFSAYCGRYPGELAIDWIGGIARRSMAAGFYAISLFGEVSPFCPGSELNCLALANYGSAANPKADLDVFLRDVAGPLLGGEDYARGYLRYARLLDDPRKMAAALDEIRTRSASLPPEAARRRTWLENYLATFIYQESRGNDEVEIWCTSFHLTWPAAARDTDGVVGSARPRK